MAKGKKLNKLRRPAKSPLQITGGKFVDALGAAAISRLKEKLGLNTETHNIQFSSSGTITTTAAVVQAPPTIAQSLYNDGRTGDSVRVTEANYKVTLFNNSTTNAANVFRVIAVYRNSYNYSALPPSELLTTSTSVVSFPNVNLPDIGGTILYDKLVNIINVGIGGKGRVELDLSFKLPEFHMTWDASDATGTPSQLAGSSIEIFAYYATHGTTTGAPTYNVSAQYLYVDN
jgi:hypothetical protein